MIATTLLIIGIASLSISVFGGIVGKVVDREIERRIENDK